VDLPERNTVSGIDFTELKARAARAESYLSAVNGELQTLLQRATAADADRLRTVILSACSLGVGNAVPVSAAGDDAAQRAALFAQAKAVAKETQSRIDLIATLRTASASENATIRRDRILERVRAVFGAGFVALPSFTCTNSTELDGAHAASTAVQGGDPLEVYSWFARCERVREAMYHLGSALRGAEVLSTGDRLQLSVVQLPLMPNDRWVGLPVQPGKSLPAGRLSLIVQAATGLDMKQPLAGLLIDEWVEVVPNQKETTALTFQFNPPDVCAPQSILLAVPPVRGKMWTGWDLQRVLLETLDLAKLRGVDPQALGELSQYLPALYFGLNAVDAAVSTDFASLTHG
jgi:hypothetical protein